jgi:hypothetical protein
MVDRFELGREFFAQLEQEDEKIAREVAAGVCQKCERGALHRSDYSRKPRGGLIAPEGEGSVTRFSLCCDQEGCRKRATPPSLRFLGRRVYLGAVVTVASMLARVIANATELRQVTGVPVRTTRRWLGWWGGPFVSTSVFVAVCARLIGVAVAELPRSIVLRLPGSPTEQVGAMLALLAPLTTSTVRDGARFLRGAP